MERSIVFPISRIGFGTGVLLSMAREGYFVVRSDTIMNLSHCTDVDGVSLRIYLSLSCFYSKSASCSCTRGIRVRSCQSETGPRSDRIGVPRVEQVSVWSFRQPSLSFR